MCAHFHQLLMYSASRQESIFFYFSLSLKHMLSMTMKLDLGDMVHVYLWMTIAECVH